MRQYRDEREELQKGAAKVIIPWGCAVPSRLAHYDDLERYGHEPYRNAAPEGSANFPLSQSARVCPDKLHHLVRRKRGPAAIKASDTRRENRVTGDNH